jgi:hypothetical protein
MPLISASSTSCTTKPINGRRKSSSPAISSLRFAKAHHPLLERDPLRLDAGIARFAGETGRSIGSAVIELDQQTIIDYLKVRL